MTSILTKYTTICIQIQRINRNTVYKIIFYKYLFDISYKHTTTAPTTTTIHYYGN